MHYFKMISIMFMAILCVILLSACEKKQESITIGFSACENETPRSVALIQDVMIAAKEDNKSIELRCADGKLSKQKKDIEELLELNPEYLVVIPVKSIGLDDILKKTYEAGVKVIILDRNMEKGAFDDYLTQIATDAYKEGELCAQALGEYFSGAEAKILEIQGQAGSSLTRDRASGFRDKLCEYVNLEIVKVIDGNFDRIEAEHGVKEYMNQGGKFDAVFGHSDEEGLGALAAFEDANLQYTTPIVSVNGQQDVKKALIVRCYLASVVSDPHVAALVLQAIENNEKGLAVDKHINIPVELYNADNAKDMKDY